MHNYRELKIWQRAMDLAVEVYKNTSSFPVEERFALTLQIHKSAVSIPSNISEGAGRDSDGQFQYFLEISMGSCKELQTQIELSRRSNYLSDKIAFHLLDEAAQIYRMTVTFYYKIGGNNPLQHPRSVSAFTSSRRTSKKNKKRIPHHFSNFYYKNHRFGLFH